VSALARVEVRRLTCRRRSESSRRVWRSLVLVPVWSGARLTGVRVWVDAGVAGVGVWIAGAEVGGVVRVLECSSGARLMGVWMGVGVWVCVGVGVGLGAVE
jgi:hypothetical protein